MGDEVIFWIMMAVLVGLLCTSCKCENVVMHCSASKVERAR